MPTSLSVAGRMSGEGAVPSTKARMTATPGGQEFLEVRGDAKAIEVHEANQR
jgi:hypothetical protein